MLVPRRVVKLDGGNSNILLFSSRTFGKWSDLPNIFQMGWFNHQLEKHSFPWIMDWIHPFSLEVVKFSGVLHRTCGFKGRVFLEGTGVSAKNAGAVWCGERCRFWLGQSKRKSSKFEVQQHFCWEELHRSRVDFACSYGWLVVLDLVDQRAHFGVFGFHWLSNLASTYV